MMLMLISNLHQVLNKDLAIFGFFIALGRSTRSFLSVNGFDVVNEPIESFIRYLISGSVLYYPQLSLISAYQLFMECRKLAAHTRNKEAEKGSQQQFQSKEGSQRYKPRANAATTQSDGGLLSKEQLEQILSLLRPQVVCEELDWLQFYPGHANTLKQSHGHGDKELSQNAEAIPQVLNVCSHWMQSHIKYSKWLENPSNVKAARFLTRGHKKLMECVDELGISRNLSDNCSNFSTERIGSITYLPTNQETDSFDKALEGVEEAVIRLENLLQEYHVSNSARGKEQLKAACSDLEKIRKLKKEAEFLRASIKAKSESLEQGDEETNLQSSVPEQQPSFEGGIRTNGLTNIETGDRKLQGLWSFIGFLFKKPDSDLAVSNESVCSAFISSLFISAHRFVYLTLFNCFINKYETIVE
ncbi:hypothetical protein LINPERHAP1_LOCUS29349 [Linum perenne]